MSLAIVYFSRTNNTHTCAQLLQTAISAKSVRLIEAKKYGIISNIFRARMSKPSKLVENPWQEVSLDDTLVIMTPVWGSRSHSAVNAFIDGADLTGKTVHLVTVQADPAKKGSQDVFDKLSARIAKKGGTVGHTTAIVGEMMGKSAASESIDEQVKSQLIPKFQS